MSDNSCPRCSNDRIEYLTWYAGFPIKCKLCGNKWEPDKSTQTITANPGGTITFNAKPDDLFKRTQNRIVRLVVADYEKNNSCKLVRMRGSNYVFRWETEE